jgi:O-methyltransferase involved in polyketide biosynthesis
MSEKIAVDLGNVQKTLFLPLWGRAFESQKENPLLVDKTALEIIDKVDYDFSVMARKISELTRIAWIMRSICVDEVIEAFLGKYPMATIVNLGCGLDTTFDRVDNGTLVWYDLDLPDVISLRRRFSKETERRRFISASFLESNWLNEIQVAENVLFIAAGVFYYFEENEVKGFLVRLADSFPGSEIVFDVSSPYGIKLANKMVITNSGLDEKSFLKWGLESTKSISAWDKRFRILNTYYYFGQKARPLKLKTRLLGFISDFLKLQYMVHLEMMERYLNRRRAR